MLLMSACLSSCSVILLDHPIQTGRTLEEPWRSPEAPRNMYLLRCTGGYAVGSTASFRFWLGTARVPRCPGAQMALAA